MSERAAVMLRHVEASRKRVGKDSNEGANNSTTTSSSSNNTRRDSAPSTAAVAAATTLSEYREELRKLEKELRTFIDKRNCHPIMLRLAWHDAGTYNRHVPCFPDCGGANGSIRLSPELKHAANAGLEKAVRFLQPFHTKHPMVSWADLIQLAGALAVELAGGPRIPMRYGRIDADVPAEEGKLPDANPASPLDHVRKVFDRLGMTPKETVALIGAHTIGRAFKERSGVTEYGYGNDKGTPHTRSTHVARGDGHAGIGMPGGQSWTSNWLSFDNAFFQQAYKSDKALLWLPTDSAVAKEEYARHFRQFASDNRSFLAAYAPAHKKLSESGSMFAFHVELD
ncbi:stromal ascorbate peroxidase [Salpingoeca rosetta]|uniref:Stromal ascorbate peroxidase n=1 Tax=Salpingoeca rosetta (strain ATCC 50818 / BSB-021) TaxID=946362 RepID=F2TVF0_SALR5|nr:stromal ascorbate peroxidase [Salpingoeca rosetta]EGD72046.1 stromal ascorbate peroxidase [Salpingoeca rosetta]|eukprot:XP_004998618.1 stromal ascorbate peroxidase [Salpingoeca rosetta]